MRHVAQTTRVDFAAVEAQVANSAARLAKHSAEAVTKINQAVVDGLIRGSGVQQVTKEVREALVGNTKNPGAGLYARAETIARTELQSATHDARTRQYEEQGVKLVQWVATEDERTCEWCGARHLNVYELGEAEIPAHPNCRCTAVPFRRNWTEEGLIDVQRDAKSQNAVDELLSANGGAPRYGATPFERANGRSAATAVWTPRSGYRRLNFAHTGRLKTQPDIAH